MSGPRKRDEILKENAQLHQLLDEAKETLRAITSGEVDALVVNTESGEQVFTLQGADTVYRVAIENINEGTLTLSPEGTILYSNHFFAQMMRTDLNRVIGSSISDFVSPESRGVLEKTLGLEIGRREVNLRSADGRCVPTYIAVRKLRLDNQESICAAVTDLTEQKAIEKELTDYRQHLEEMVEQRTSELEQANADLTREVNERRRTEEALKESQKKYQALVESTSDFIWEVDAHWRYTYCSPQSETLWGFKPEALLGTTPFDHMPPEAKGAAMKNFLELLQGKPFRIENISYNNSGECITIEVSGAPFFDEAGKLLGYRGISRDITEHKRDEEKMKQYTIELESANRELESFSYSISHDLRAPLRTLDGFSEILIQDYGDKLDQAGKDYLNRIRKASQNMSRLIDDMARLSRITRTDMALKQVNLSEMALSILNELKAALPERQVDFVIAPEVKTNADGQLIRILLQNLLENAWKFTSKGSLTKIEFGCVHSLEGKNTYFIKDNGAGFDMKHTGRLFQPFQRLHSDTEYAGTGIGLAIVQRVILRHGGSIWAESEPGKGATFYFTLQ